MAEVITPPQLPVVLMGPMIRRACADVVCFQLVTSKACTPNIKLEGISSNTLVQTLQLGHYCHLHFILLEAGSDSFPVDTLLSYQLFLDDQVEELSQYAYNGRVTPQFCIPYALKQVLHGSCRNAHHPSQDSLISVDRFIEKERKEENLAPSLLLMSGDQIYADDIAGPMLIAVHQIIDKLGLFKEAELAIDLPNELLAQLYNRDKYLPYTPWQTLSKKSLNYWRKKNEPHFSSVKASNHLIYLEEFIACHLLNFSAITCALIDWEEIESAQIEASHRELFQSELSILKTFFDGQHHAQRIFANMSVLTMFDDHDVTDDWNLTAKWEQGISSSPVSKRIISNGLISYWLFQGLGNDALTESATLIPAFNSSLDLNAWHLTKFDKKLHMFGFWHYELDTIPKVVVMDTRTHRWRNEHDFNEPSGLMDWERLMELQDSMVNNESIILVSPAPVFGVKVIEAIQAMFNACGEPLAVDVENWMAHEGAAKKLISIFKRQDTPKETIILSGDVHYSFCFSVSARFGRHDNKIWQLTCSGIKNEFPKSLLGTLDYLDTFLYGRFSPLNFFTKRWQLEVKKHKATLPGHRYLVSDSAMSLVEIKDGSLKKYTLLHGSGKSSGFNIND